MCQEPDLRLQETEEIAMTRALTSGGGREDGQEIRNEGVEVIWEGTKQIYREFAGNWIIINIHIRQMNMN